MIATYQTRILEYSGVDRAAGDAALSAYGELYGRVERKLFAEVAAGRSATALKSAYLKRCGIPARMFNAVRVSLEGKVESVREQQKLRRLANLRHRLATLEADSAAGRVRLCFGSKRLWRKQHHLEANGYASHDEWLRDWQGARSDEFFVLGSRDETGGCQLCVAGIAEDGSLTLRLRMPDCLADRHGKYVTMEGVNFAYGQEQVAAALESNVEYTRYRRQHGEKAVRGTELGQAISYRFKRDGKGWRVFATTGMMDVPVVTDQRWGVIGVDLNADHLAVAETDASGNFIKAFSVPLVTYGKSAHQAEAIIGDAVASVVEYARQACKPIVMERLDFRHKKASLEGQSPGYSRMLSSFSYGKLKAYFLSRGYREGVEVHQVNPAFSSVIGRVKFMERYGLSVHQAAALALARRLLGCSERIPRRWVAPVGNGIHVSFTVPARKRVKHVWTHWGAISGQLGPAPCSATSAGEAETQTQSGPGCHCGLRLAGWPEQGPDRCSLVRFPGGAALNCWGGGAAWTASSEKADHGLATIVNLFYNGDGSIDIYDDFLTTLAGCTHPAGVAEQEERYVELLPKFERYHIYGDLLVVHTEDGAILLFQAE